MCLLLLALCSVRSGYSRQLRLMWCGYICIFMCISALILLLPLLLESLDWIPQTLGEHVAKVVSQFTQLKKTTNIARIIC